MDCGALIPEIMEMTSNFTQWAAESPWNHGAGVNVIILINKIYLFYKIIFFIKF